MREDRNNHDEGVWHPWPNMGTPYAPSRFLISVSFLFFFSSPRWFRLFCFTKTPSVWTVKKKNKNSRTGRRLKTKYNHKRLFGESYIHNRRFRLHLRPPLYGCKGRCIRPECWTDEHELSSHLAENMSGSWQFRLATFQRQWNCCWLHSVLAVSSSVLAPRRITGGGSCVTSIGGIGTLWKGKKQSTHKIHGKELKKEKKQHTNPLDKTRPLICWQGGNGVIAQPSGQYINPHPDISFPFNFHLLIFQINKNVTPHSTWLWFFLSSQHGSL